MAKPRETRRRSPLGRRRATKRKSRLSAALALAALAGSFIGCAARGPDLFPPTPIATHPRPDGGVDRLYDTDGDGTIDYGERLSPGGRVVVLRYDLDGDERLDLEIDRLEALRGDADGSGDVRHLMILLDSIPFEMVRDLWNQGRFRLFHPPSRVISPFPVMTDPCFTEFFGMSPCLAVESHYYDGTRLNNGYDAYANGEIAHWMSVLDYQLPPIAHLLVYSWPQAWYGHELGRIQRRFLAREEGNYIGYSVATSGLGAHFGRNGHVSGLIQLDRMCQTLVQRMRGRVQITLLSDHGHAFLKSRRIPLTDVLERSGYRVGKRLERPNDVVVPQFGVVTYAAIYTSAPADVARDVAGIEGVELVAYRDDQDRVVVLSRDGRARISRSQSRYRYVAEFGDPLRLSPVLQALGQAGAVDSDGFVGDRALFEATLAHEYPDAVQRLWRAFHGLVVHVPDVLISVKDGWHFGDKGMSKALDIAAVHGNLNAAGSSAFAMSTAGELPAVLRMEDLGGALRELGVPLPQPASNENPLSP